MKVLKFIYKNLDRFKTKFVFVFLIGILDGLATFFIPVALAEFTKNQFASSDFSSLIRFIITFYLASLISQWVIKNGAKRLALNSEITSA